ncbi:MAG: TonB-dependent receptor [Myxococcota bacterium]
MVTPIVRSPRPRSTREKALELNLDASWYGSFAEIGAGQEVARWFFRVGAAAGTIAKTMSAYDMQVSDAIYGETDRYVSRGRLRAMLEHEYTLNIERLREARGQRTRFFAFADTVAAQRFGSTANCHGWMGIRFQDDVLSEWSEIILHARLLDTNALLQHEALGVLGVNLIHAASVFSTDPALLIEALADDLGPGRLEVDMIEFSGSAYANTDNRVMSVKLVEQGLTRAAMFDPSGEVLQPSEALYKKPVLVQRGRFRPPTRVHADIQQKAVAAVAAKVECRAEDVVALVEMKLSELREVNQKDMTDFLDRISALGASDRPVLISDLERHDEVINYVLECDAAQVGLVLNGLEIASMIAGESTAAVEMSALEICHRIFRPGVSVLMYPAIDRETGQRLEFDGLAWSDAVRHLIRYLIDTGRLSELPGLPDDQLRFRSDEVLALIREGDPRWTEWVEPAVAEVIQRDGLFGCGEE